MKEGTSAVLLQSGLDNEWWADSMECYRSLRNIQDLLSDGKTPYERLFGIPFNGPVIPFGAMVEFRPISAKDPSRLHQFGPKVLPDKFFGYALNARGIWKGDIPVAVFEELEQMDASEIHARRLTAEEVLTPMKGENFIFPVSDRRLRTSTLIRERFHRGEEQEILRGESDGLFSPSQHQDDSTQDDVEAKMTSGLLQEVSFIAITWDLESNCTRRKKNHCLLRRSISTLPEPHTRHWMC